MKAKFIGIALTIFFISVYYFWHQKQSSSDLDVYQYVQQCKAELGVTEPLPQLSCLDGTPVPIYVNNQEINEENWEQIAEDRQCDNPHWLGGDMGCWTYSHLQVLQLNEDNIMVLNCRQKGNQLSKNWFRRTNTNLGMDQYQRREKFERANLNDKDELYFLYNTFNDIGLIFRNIKTGKACYLTQYGEAVAGFLPPLDKPLPDKDKFLALFNPEQSRPPKDFPVELWHRDANAAFKSPSFTAAAGCVDCHNAHGVKYSPYINSKHGLPTIGLMAPLPFLPVGEPYIEHFRKNEILQITTDDIDGEKQLCTRCHKMTTSGTCGYSIDIATGHPNRVLMPWLTTGAVQNRWMPPIEVELSQIKKHVSAIKCCCENPHAKGCKSRQFGPTRADLPKDFERGGGWVDGNEPGLCESIVESYQWNAEEL